MLMVFLKTDLLLQLVWLSGKSVGLPAKGSRAHVWELQVLSPVRGDGVQEAANQ